MIVDERMAAFIDSLDRGNASFLDEIEKRALEEQIPIVRRSMQSLLKFLLAAWRPGRILEVGTAIGFSALLMSEYGPPGCHVTTIEKYEKRIPAALENFRRAGKEKEITLLEGDAMERIGTLLKKLTGWTLGGLLTLFITYLAVSGAVAGAVDAHAVKLARSAVSAAVPVVGGILSEAAESLLAGAGILKGMVGTFGTLAVLGACLLPVLRLGCQYLLYQGASLVSSAAGPGKLTKLIAMLGDAFGLVLAMTGAAAMLLLVSLISSITALSPG